MKTIFATWVVLIATTIAHAAPSTQPTTAPASIRVMSFNLRTGTAPDGGNAWPKRTQLVRDAIATFDPDLLGTQEVVGFQRAWLQEQFADYGFFGVSRIDGRDDGEGAPLLFRRDRFDVLAAGHFWLSETPDVPGSVGWDAAFPRITTWARLRDRTAGTVLVFANTHFDHRGNVAREKSATLMRTHLATIADGVPLILAGDFNAPVDGPAYRALIGDDLRDTFRVVHRTPPADGEGTFHGFTGRPGKDRIDWIVASPAFAVESATIDRTNADGRYPSDHFPIAAVLTIATTRPAVEGVTP